MARITSKASGGMVRLRPFSWRCAFACCSECVSRKGCFSPAHWARGVVRCRYLARCAALLPVNTRSSPERRVMPLSSKYSNKGMAYLRVVPIASLSSAALAEAPSARRVRTACSNWASAPVEKASSFVMRTASPAFSREAMARRPREGSILQLEKISSSVAGDPSASRSAASRASAACFSNA